MTPSLGIEPGPHWLEVHALNTAQGMIDFGYVSRFILCGSLSLTIAKTLLLSTVDHLKTAVTFNTKLCTTGVSKQ